MSQYKIEFKEISIAELRNRLIRSQESKYPVRFFLILKRGIEVGMIGLEEVDKEVAELSLTVFRPYQYTVLSYTSLQDIFNFPFSLGFKKVIGWTRRKSWIKLLKQFKPLGIRFMDKPPEHDQEEGKFWYENVKDKENV